MARAVGNLETFNPKRHNFPKYVQWVKLYFTANDIPNAHRKSVFLSALGYETYDILANVFDDSEAQTFDTLVERLTNHFHPKSSVVAEQYKFGYRRQGDSESIADFVADLKSLAACCRFKANALDETLRNRFVCGLSNEFIQSRPLTEASR
uniref:Retrotransposon gag domain-containing protein n=1 Tax=Amphimedon queenslandica TaxID=400682 RepID=A0A1X7URJ3_AMPQE